MATRKLGVPYRTGKPYKLYEDSKDPAFYRYFQGTVSREIRDAIHSALQDEKKALPYELADIIADYAYPSDHPSDHRVGEWHYPRSSLAGRWERGEPPDPPPPFTPVFGPSRYPDVMEKKTDVPRSAAEDAARSKRKRKHEDDQLLGEGRRRRKKRSGGKRKKVIMKV